MHFFRENALVTLTDNHNWSLSPPNVSQNQLQPTECDHGIVDVSLMLVRFNHDGQKEYNLNSCKSCTIYDALPNIHGVQPKVYHLNPTFPMSHLMMGPKNAKGNNFLLIELVFPLIVYMFPFFFRKHNGE